MLEAIIAWSLSRRIAVLAGAAIVCLVGWVAVNRLVIDAFPDTTPVQVQINTVAPGMVAEEIERQITFPVELAMGGMPGLEGIRSASMFGLSVVIVTFQDGTDIYFARQLINERLGTVGVPAARSAAVWRSRSVSGALSGSTARANRRLEVVYSWAQ